MSPATLLALLLASAVTARAAGSYDQAVLADRPALFLSVSACSAGAEPDLSGHGLSGAYHGAPSAALLPDGETACRFDGISQFLSVPADPALSVPAAGSLTIESWIRPDTLQFPHSEAEGYVYWLGKGDPSHGYEYANRMYSLVDSAGRPNRVSDYAWNTSGGLGSGSYFQDALTAGQWLMVTDVIDMGAGVISIYKNGILRKTTPLSQYSVTPGVTSAPLNIGTRNGGSWFEGAIGKVAVYPRALDGAAIARHYAAMVNAAAPAPVVDPPAPAALDFRAPQRFLSPAKADGVNDEAVFGPDAATVAIYSVRGRRVFSGSRSGGAIRWNGRDPDGRLVAGGLYLARIQTDDGRTAYQSFAVVK